jgi:predicted AAA+ superfamily ATPase
MKAEVDRNRTPGRFLLTGSANVLLVPRLSEALAGRVELLSLWPLSQGEIEGREEHFVDAAFGAKMPGFEKPAVKKREVEIIERIVRGGYPEPLTRPAGPRRSAWYASYLTTILQRDVRDLANIEGLADFPRLLALIASRTSGLLNFSDLSRSLSMPQSTLKRYFALLEATFLVVTLPAWSSNQGLRLAKAPKVMLADTGLACHVLGTDEARLKTDGHARGALLENFVAMELTKQIGWSKVRPKLYHFRTTAGREVDLVLEDAAGRVVGIEIKASSSVDSGAFAGLRALREAAGSKFVRGIVLHDGAETVPFEKDLAAVPLGAVWR